MTQNPNANIKRGEGGEGFYHLDVSPCTHSLAVSLEDGGVGPLAELLQLNVRLQLSEGRVALQNERKEEPELVRGWLRKEGLIMQISFRIMIRSLSQSRRQNVQGSPTVAEGNRVIGCILNAEFDSQST